MSRINLFDALPRIMLNISHNYQDSCIITCELPAICSKIILCIYTWLEIKLVHTIVLQEPDKNEKKFVQEEKKKL